jgi:methionyl-tRNA synthetase
VAAVEGGFEAVGAQIEQARFRAGLAEAMHLATRVNQYVSEEAPWASMADDRERAGTVLHVALRCIDNLKLLFTPFLPHSSQALHEMLGHEGAIAGPLVFRDVEEEDGSTHTVLTGDYDRWTGSWHPQPFEAGRRLQEPRPLFRKLDAAKVVASELERMQQSAGA